jgi:multiple sugar transport system substrate-binding protein
MSSLVPVRQAAGSITRRAALGVLTASALGYAAFGPRVRGEAPAGRKVLDYWEKWTRHEGEAMRRVVDAFNASQDRLWVRYLVTADIGQKTMIAVAGGDPPDLVGLYSFNVPPYAEAGALVRLDELAPRFGVRLEQYAPGVRPVMQHSVGGRGGWWALVNTCGSVALYYNKTLFREVGLDPARPPRTIAELDEYHRRMLRAGGAGGAGADGRIERVGFLHREPGWWSWLWGYHFGAGVYDAASDRATVDAAGNIAAYEWMQGYARDLGVERVVRFQDGFGNYFTPENPFLTGKVGMIVQGPWVANLVKAFKPGFEYGVAPFPTADGSGAVGGVGGAGPVGLIDTDVIVIPRGAKDPEASMEFIAWTQRRDMVELLATAHCKPSPLLDQSEGFIASHPNTGIAVHDAILRSERAFVAPATRVWSSWKDAFDTSVQRMWRLESTAQDELSALQRRAQAMIDRAADERRRRGGGVGVSGGGGA